MEVRVKKLDPRAMLPRYGSEYSAGADVYALMNESVTIEPHKTAFIHTGLSVEIPEGNVGLIFARSSLGTKKGLAPANKVGVIDSDYRGEIMVALFNHSDEAQIIEPFERVAQFVVVPFIKAQFSESETLSDTTRGQGGFGSTGRK